MATLRAWCLPGLLLMVATASADPGAASCPSAAFAARVQQGLAGYADVVDIPGISLGIVHRGRLVHTAAHGHADRRRRVSATPGTLFNLASVTKPFTATLALQLAEDGVIDLDAPVVRYLAPGTPVPTAANGSPILVRHLLMHTSGLPRDPPNRRNQATGAALDPGIWDAYSVTDLRAGLLATEVEGEPGETFAYSNFGYALLGHALEHAAGQPYEALLHRRLLQPLGMADTAITLSPDQRSRLAAHYWSEDGARREQDVRARFGDVAGFIGLTSSVNDLSKFVAAHLGHGAEDGPISAAVAARMREGAQLIDQDAPFRFEATLGWQRVTRLHDGEVAFVHTGEVDGHTAGLFLSPGHDLGVIVLQDLGGVDGADAIERFGQWLLRIAPAELASCEP